MKAVIFDKDGVLVETFDFYFEGYKKVLSEIGIKIVKDDIAKRYGMKGPEIIKQIIKEKGKNITDVQTMELANKKDRIYKNLSEKKLKLLPGVKKLLTHLKKKNYKIGIASSASKEIIEQLIRIMKLNNYIDAIVDGLEVKFSKPNPEIFLKCAKKLRVKPKDCVVVEDSVHGVKAAKRAKMKCIAIATGQHSKTELKNCKPDLLLDSLEEFDKILSFLNSSP
jgi:beta-phosphoglucomutase